MKRCDNCGDPARTKGARHCTACQSYWRDHGRERPYRGDGRTLRFLGHNPTGVQPRWAEALALREAGLGYPEIEARMGVTPRTARDYVKNARAALREVG